ncbi:MAG TPA: hypothetical protein VJ853_14555 [Thermoanaerobaculia bacterium]|nr:hypothetical protein [Thermoanaerobaculia bacterium]
MRWLLAIAALVFLAMWGWRELGMRAVNERIASRDAEIGRLQLENDSLRAQIARMNREVTTGNIFSVTAPPNVSARVLLDPQQRAFVVVLAPRGSYELDLNGQKIATIDVPKSAQKTMMLDHLPALSDIKTFELKRK